MTMPAPHNEPCTPLEAALAYARLGFHVLPITPGRKHPPIQGWQDAATTDPDVITSWWTGLYRDHGIGIATGPKSGIWVLDVDVSDGKPGRENLEALIAEHGPLPATVTAVTGTGGRHFLFAWDPARPVTNGHATHLPPGLDIRGEGGQIVVAPTIHPNGTPYTWREQRTPTGTPVEEAPDWLYQLMTPEPNATSVVEIPQQMLHSPSDQGKRATAPEDSAAAWIRAQHHWPDVLTRDGWTEMHTRGDDTYWCRPGKNPRDGHSAVQHGADGPLVIFTSEIPVALTNAGRPTIDGSGVSVSMFGYLAGTRYNGDRSACARDARLAINALQKPAKGLAVSPPGPGLTLVGAAEQGAPNGPLNLPEEFWAARPELRHIRQAAWSRLLSPDAVFAVILARVAASTHPAICIPSIIGAPASLSCYTALTGPPGTGKSTSIAAAGELAPLTSNPKVVQGGQLGSGEGLVELYIGEIPNPNKDDSDNRKTIRVHNKDGAFVTLDEGAALAELGQRKGSTVLSVLRSMWTGGAIGQSNASKETTRSLRAGGYNLGFVIGIQPSLAGALLSDDAAGTPQRFLWARTTDPLIPADPVDWPGRLPWDPPTRRGDFGAELAIDPWIAREIRSSALARNRGELIIDALDAHADLLRLKVAGILAILNGRQDVTTEDWALAAIVVDTSTAVRTDVANTVRWEADERARGADRASARRAVVAAAATAEHQLSEFERALDSAAKAAARRIAKDGTGSRRDIARAISSRDRRVVSVDEAVDHAITCGWLIQEDDGSFRRGAEIQ